MNTDTKLVYRIDSQDRIVFVNENWQKFATTNDASELTKENVLNRSIWDFITDETTRHFYREVLERVRSNKPVFFNFRCDSPDHKRFMKMKISCEFDEVIFETETLNLEKRDSQRILNRNEKRSNNLVVICGWCKKINISKMLWQEVEHAIETLGIFETEKLPQLSHGMCNHCYTDFTEQFKEKYSLQT